MTPGEQLAVFIGALVDCIADAGVVGMRPEPAAALAALREFNYRRIYARPDSIAQGRAVVAVLRALVEYYADRPHALPEPAQADPGSPRPGSSDAVRAAVGYVAGMTDRYAFQTALAVLDWDADKLPRGIDVPVRRG